MTRRDLQNQAKDMGRPWDMGKGFDKSAPIGEIYPASEVGHSTRAPSSSTSTARPARSPTSTR